METDNEPCPTCGRRTRAFAGPDWDALKAAARGAALNYRATPNQSLDARQESRKAFSQSAQESAEESNRFMHGFFIGAAISVPVWLVLGGVLHLVAVFA